MTDFIIKIQKKKNCVLLMMGLGFTMLGVPSCFNEQKIEKLPEMKISFNVSGTTMTAASVSALTRSLCNGEAIRVDLSIDGDQRPRELGVLSKALGADEDPEKLSLQTPGVIKVVGAVLKGPGRDASGFEYTADIIVREGDRFCSRFYLMTPSGSVVYSKYFVVKVDGMTREGMRVKKMHDKKLADIEKEIKDSSQGLSALKKSLASGEAGPKISIVVPNTIIALNFHFDVHVPAADLEKIASMQYRITRLGSMASGFNSVLTGGRLLHTNLVSYTWARGIGNPTDGGLYDIEVKTTMNAVHGGGVHTTKITIQMQAAPVPVVAINVPTNVIIASNFDFHIDILSDLAKILRIEYTITKLGNINALPTLIRYPQLHASNFITHTWAVAPAVGDRYEIQVTIVMSGGATHTVKKIIRMKAAVAGPAAAPIVGIDVVGLATTSIGFAYDIPTHEVANIASVTYEILDATNQTNIVTTQQGVATKVPGRNSIVCNNFATLPVSGQNYIIKITTNMSTTTPKRGPFILTKLITIL